jgi:hypothetical protein
MNISNYREQEIEKVRKLDIFNENKENLVLLNNGENNLYSEIKEDVISYFHKNKISFWTCEKIGEKDDKKPTCHTLSSQITCLNHLFPLRNDKNAVLSIAQKICPEITEVIEITSDKYSPAYIAFEVVSDIDHLKEKCSLRGKFCTSIDALIYAKHKNGKKVILPIEWKYAEFYNDKDFSIEDRPYKPKGNEERGKERLRRYSDFITQSTQLETLPNYRSSVYFFDPFYQLMRQTLWAEQMKAYSGKETIKSDDFIHVHVIPQENKDLLDKIYPCSGKDMETTWRDCLSNQDKYKIISPKDLLANIDKNKYADLIKYLETRYW